MVNLVIMISLHGQQPLGLLDLLTQNANKKQLFHAQIPSQNLSRSCARNVQIRNTLEVDSDKICIFRTGTRIKIIIQSSDPMEKSSSYGYNPIRECGNIFCECGIAELQQLFFVKATQWRYIARVTSLQQKPKRSHSPHARADTGRPI